MIKWKARKNTVHIYFYKPDNLFDLLKMDWTFSQHHLEHDQFKGYLQDLEYKNGKVEN